MSNQAIPERVIHEATLWLVRMRSGEATSVDESALRRWRDADPLHDEEWLRLMDVEGAFASVPTTMRREARQTLERKALSSTRRGALKLLLLGSLGGGAAWHFRDEISATRAMADLSAGVGDTTSTVLASGVRLTLNTATAVDVRGNGVRLLQGELFADASAVSAFHIDTMPARIEANGRISVRLLDDGMRLSVIDGTAQIEPRNGADGLSVRGEVLLNQRGRIKSAGSVGQMDHTAWLQRRLVVEDMPLSEFLEELWRYRHGAAFTSAAAARFRISGGFDLDDIDGALRAVQATHPVIVRNLDPLGVWLGLRKAV